MENIKNPIFCYLLAILLFIGLFLLDQIAFVIPIIGKQISDNQSFVLAIGVLLMGIVVSVACYLARKNGSLKPLRQTITKQNWKFILGMFALTYISQLALQLIFQFLGISGNTVNQQVIEQSMNSLPRWYMGLMILIVAPIVEEFLCRSLVFQTIRNKKVAFIVAMLIFTLLHVQTLEWNVLIYLVMSLILTATYARHENLNESITVHFLNNLIGFVALLVM
ncbi:CPBP family intramembrane metalloprotease [Enterococcus cecorum]|uniref:CPBP family intramembrane glutamic endopeptidase n=1 Tax=Enterococcus cecorum TaxID=44008 RepID=UPI000761E98D|nr:type II CAAX endopeptidase family protein [Enterococcus cecorum]MCJ0534486.1 CPBP family intramembrane metalloprotease [Enterococcus cecorum]MCJ0554397.1 CPBP family intramembrane metalloprotease [Enterococcus cecorum]MDZ5546760.1 type II CAAX endopeptidase family protein [Enterococcus cecorum]MDZ5575007.1 type II CAAX endopeptidase family protein [Enterococcus cecorum]MDZ5581718.1 type II CAAX endopeptidase family protein [Enterococcus cecorum]